MGIFDFSPCGDPRAATALLVIVVAPAPLPWEVVVSLVPSLPEEKEDVPAAPLPFAKLTSIGKPSKVRV